MTSPDRDERPDRDRERDAALDRLTMDYPVDVDPPQPEPEQS